MGVQVVSRTSQSTPVIDALWLDVLHRITAHAAHELKGALNGVSVNLEVVRSRAKRPETQVPAIVKYADAAADQLGAVIVMSDALLMLARTVRTPVELAPVLKHMGALLAPAARADGRQLDMDGTLDGLGITSANGDAVRLAIGSSLLAGIEGSTHVRCTAADSSEVPALRIESCDGKPLAVVGAVVVAAAEAEIRITVESSAISISFPR